GDAWDAAVRYWRTLASDEGAQFDNEVTIGCSSLQPQVTWGTSHQHGTLIDGVVPPPPDSSAERALGYMRLEPGTRLAGLPIDVASIRSRPHAPASHARV